MTMLMLFAPQNVTSGASAREGEGNFLGLLSFAIFYDFLKNYAIIRHYLYRGGVNCFTVGKPLLCYELTESAVQSNSLLVLKNLCQKTMHKDCCV